MRFQNREQAASSLVAGLARYRGQAPLVLGIPRGGVPMARVIKDALDGDIDVALVRKLRAPGQAELAIGAIDDTGTVLKGSFFDIASAEYVRREIQNQLQIIRERRRLYTHSQPPTDPAGRLVIVVDDGIATGSSMLAAIRSLRARGARRIVVAAAVAPPSSLAAVQAEADEVVCLWSPDNFYCVGQFFEDFSDVTDEMVTAALTGLGAAASTSET